MPANGAFVGSHETAAEAIEVGLIKDARSVSDDRVRKPFGVAQILELTKPAGLSTLVAFQSHIIDHNGLELIINQAVEGLLHIETLVYLGKKLAGR